MPKLLSVNVGMPKDVSWQGRTVHTGIWKTPVAGPVTVRRLNVEGDGQGDLAGHGGEQRAVLVYQAEAYEYWGNYLQRDDLQWGSFGENLTVTGLGDHEVCIGDRYRIGEAEFEVTQPRVTCFRVGMRLSQPDLPQLLVAHHRPGFYCRVLTEGRVQAGDEIVLLARGRHELSVADIDALLYLPDPDVGLLRAALDQPALSPGWRQSFADLLAHHDTPPVAGWAGFRPLRVSATRHETPTILSIELESDDGRPLPQPLPGQYLTIQVDGVGGSTVLRSYSLSGDRTAGRYRISVKRETHGRVSRWLHQHIRVGSVVTAAAPRGDFYLADGDGPVVLLSADVGITPVLAMLHALRTASPRRRVVWVHTVSSIRSQAFAGEVDELIAAIPGASQHIFYTADGNRLGREALAALELPLDADVYLCGPSTFMDDMRTHLVDIGFSAGRLHTEVFGPLPSIRPGVVGATATALPHPPPGAPGSGPQVTFSRSGLTADFGPKYPSLLEFAEACDVAVRYSCRSGVCHTPSPV